MRRVAVVGSGISGLAAAHSLAGEAAITLFEAEAWFGGHAHTVDVRLACTFLSTTPFSQPEATLQKSASMR